MIVPAPRAGSGAPRASAARSGYYGL